MTLAGPVLVVGAGPTGLSLALQAAEHGAAVRVVEQRPDAFRPSRALLVHPRTLEVLRPLGVIDELLERADTSPTIALRLGRRVVPVTLTRLALHDTAFPHLTLLRQADVESVLIRALSRHDVRVEYETTLTDVVDAGGAARARLRGPDGERWERFAAVVGCDGVNSTVRTRLGLGWPGGIYRHEIVLADLDLDSELQPGIGHVAAGASGLTFLFPRGECADWRMLATRPCAPEPLAPGHDGPPLGLADLQAMLQAAGLSTRIRRVGWSTRVRVQHRIATGYRRGRVFIAGDAAHASSPAGGTGMNTGIQDATNLGWKLAGAGRSTEPETLLGSYETERRPAAQHVLALTGLIFWAESATDPAASFLRGRMAPLLAPALPLLLRRRHLVAEAFRMLAQLHVSYRGSPLSQGGGRPRPGDRLPDATVASGGRDVRLHELLAGPGVHVLLDRDAEEPPRDLRSQTAVLRLHSSVGQGWIAVRPDGHIGFTSVGSDATGLRRWLRLVGVGPARSTPHTPRA